MIIVNEIKDPKFLEQAAKAVDNYLAKEGLVAGISNGFVVDSGVEYLYATFVCQVYPKDEPEGSEECELIMLQVRLCQMDYPEVCKLESPFF